MPKLLIVEDDTDIVENLSVLLEDEGYSVYHAPDVKSALNKLHTENIDLVLLILHCPMGMGIQSVLLLSVQQTHRLFFSLQ